MFAYCNNNPVNTSDPTGEFGLFTLSNAIFDGVVGAAVGGATYNVVALATGNTALASAAGSAAEAFTNEVGSYITGKKKLTAENIGGSIANIACKTVEGTITAATTGTLAAKVVKTNNKWFKPKKLISCFTGKYAKKVLKQTAVQGAMTTIWNTAKYYFRAI